MENNIELGDTVKCKYTGYTGVVVAKSIFINGCVQFTILPKWDKKMPLAEQEHSIDSESLVIIKKKIQPKIKKEKSTGGPMRKGFKQRGF